MVPVLRVVGAPGSGKTLLIVSLAEALRSRGQRVATVAPRRGGATVVTLSNGARVTMEQPLPLARVPAVVPSIDPSVTIVLAEDYDAPEDPAVPAIALAARSALPYMKEKGYGRMVFTSSITGPRVTSPGHGHYSASKAGINGFIKSAALEFAAHGITVNGVEPGNIMTEGMKIERSADYIRAMAESIPLGRLGAPRDVANAVAFLASDEASYITGTTIIVDGGQTLPEGKDFKS